MGTTINAMANNKLSMDFIRLSTGNKINSASDDPSGLAIAEKLQAEINGLEQGMRNTADMQGLIDTADSGLSGISDNLQRVRELSLQASNGTLTDSDRGLIQEEIGQLMKGITSTVNSTQFNNQNLLDGSSASRNTASNPNGSGAQVNIGNMSLEALGLEDYNVTKAFDISKIDDAINRVNGTRAELGAQSNRSNYTIDANSMAMINQAAAKSRIADADMAKAAKEYSRDRVTEDYQIFSQARQQQNMQSQMNVML